MMFPIVNAHTNPRVFETSFGGLNLRENAAFNELSYMKNLCSDKFPFICPSAKKETVHFDTEFQTIQAVYNTEDDELSGFSGIADGNFYYKGTHIPLKYSFMNMSCEDDISLIDFNSKIIIHAYMYVYEYSNPSKKSYVYPLNDGYYNNTIDVHSYENQPASITLIDSNDTWTEKFTAGEYIDIWVEDNTYASLIPNYKEYKYDTRTDSEIIQAIVTSVTDEVLYVDFLTKYGKRKAPTDSKYKNPISYEFSHGSIAVFKYIPPMSHICISKNRLWGVHSYGEGIFASAPGEPSAFYRFAGLSTDSWYTEVGASGKFSGICAFSDYILAFKSNIIYQIYGNSAANFCIAKQIKNYGCITPVCQAGNSVYFLNTDGLYEYSGGLPQNISEKIKLKCSSGSGFTDGKKIYLSVDDKNTLYAYDIALRLWHIEDTVRITGGFKLLNGVVYHTSSSVFKSTDEYSNSWEAQTTDIYEKITPHKGINNLFIRLYNGQNSHAEVFVSVNDSDFESCGKITDTGDFTIRIPIRFKKADKYKIRITGEGYSIIKGIERVVYAGGAAVTRKG